MEEEEEGSKGGKKEGETEIELISFSRETVESDGIAKLFWTAFRPNNTW